jgi:uncharacterized protein YkwD
MRFLAALLLVLALVQTPRTSAGVRETTQVDRRSALEIEVVQELNRARLDRGLWPLRTTPSLRTAARLHTKTMLDVGFFGHDSPDGTSFGDRVRRYYTNRGWHRWAVAETLLASSGTSTDARAVVSAWLDSPPHRTIILDPAFRDVGVGAFHSPHAPGEYAGSNTVAVTADFGLRTGKT